jgi:rod shape determining protein RodA
MQGSSSLGSAVKGFSDPREPRIVKLDVLLLLAAIGLIACSIYTIGTATQDDIEGSPYHYVIRQSVYGVVGIALMLLVTRFDYSRLRELRLGLYGAALLGIVFVLGLGATTRGSKRWIELPFFRFQPSELGKVLLVLALSAFVVDRARRLSERETTSRILLLALIPAILVVAQPDLGTGMV